MSFKRTTAINKILGMKARKKVVQGGTSAGKTFGILPILIDKATKTGNLEISIVSESIPHLRRGALKDFLKIMRLTGRFVPDHYNKSHLKYTFANGSYIEFFSADQEDRLRGARRDILYMNEANNIFFQAYHQLAIRTRLDIYLDFNPTEEFWAHTEVLKEADSELLILTYLDNEALPENVLGEIDNAIIKSATSAYWQNWVDVYVHGKIGNLQGVVFESWDQIDDVPPGANYIGMGLDFGYTNDPSAAIAMYEWDGKVIFDEVLYKRGLQNSELVRLIQAYRDGFENVVADSAEPKSIDDIASYGVEIEACEKGRDSINFGIQLMHEREILITATSTNLIKEFRNYKWRTDRSGAKQNTPEDAFNHGIDAARYIYTAKYNNKYSGQYNISRI